MTQTASDPADALQVGLYGLLSGDATLTALANVYDGVPEGAELNYVVLGEMDAQPDGVHNGHGRETSAVLHTWTEAESHRPGNTIGARLVALLWHRHADLDALVTGHKVWRIEHEFSQTLVDPTPGIRHRVDRFRIWSTQEA